jgi:hypothetical protein
MIGCAVALLPGHTADYCLYGYLSGNSNYPVLDVSGWSAMMIDDSVEQSRIIEAAAVGGDVEVWVVAV